MPEPTSLIDPRTKDIAALLSAEADGTIGPKSKAMLEQLRETGEVPPNLHLKTGFAEGMSPDQYRTLSSVLDAFRDNPGSVFDPEGKAVLSELIKQNPNLFQFSLTSPVPTIKSQPGRTRPFGPREKPFMQKLAEQGPTAIGATIGAQAGTVGGIPGRLAGAALGGAAGRGAGFVFGIEEPSESALERAGELGKSATVEGIMEAAFAGAGKGFRRISGPTLTQRSLARSDVRLAEREGIELTLAQTTQASPIIILDSVLKRALGTQKTFQAQQLRQNTDLVRMFDRLAENISSRKIGRRELGIVVSETGNRIRQAAGAELGRIEDAIVSEVPEEIIEKVTKTVRLSKILTEKGKPFVVTETQREIIRGKFITFTPKAEQEIKRLLAEANAIEQAAGAPPGTKTSIQAIKDILFPVDTPLTIREALQASKNLRLLGESRKGQLGGSIRAARGELLDTIADSLDRSGVGDLAQELRSAKKRYGEIATALDTTFFKSLKRTPEALGIALANRRSGLNTAEAINTVFKETGGVPREVRRAFVEEIFHRAQTEGILTGNRIEMVLNKQIGDDVVRAVLKKEEADILLKDIKTLANLIDIPANVTRPPSSVSPSLLAFGQTGIAAGGVAAAATGQPGVGAAIVIGALGAPWAASRILTSKSGPALLRQAVKTKELGLQFGPKLALRLLSAALTE